MTFTEALAALHSGQLIYRPITHTYPLVLQSGTVPVWVVPPNSNCAHWSMCKFVMTMDRCPYAFSDAEIQATDWATKPPQE